MSNRVNIVVVHKFVLCHTIMFVAKIRYFPPKTNLVFIFEVMKQNVFIKSTDNI